MLGVVDALPGVEAPGVENSTTESSAGRTNDQEEHVDEPEALRPDASSADMLARPSVHGGVGRRAACVERATVIMQDPWEGGSLGGSLLGGGSLGALGDPSRGVTMMDDSDDDDEEEEEEEDEDDDDDEDDLPPPLPSP